MSRLRGRVLPVDTSPGVAGFVEAKKIEPAVASPHLSNSLVISKAARISSPLRGSDLINNLEKMYIRCYNWSKALKRILK